MAQFQQHPDGRVYVRTDTGTYEAMPADFETDFGASLPALPVGAVERIYEPGVRHAIGDGHSVIAGGDMPWDFGDRAIAAIAALLAAQAKRQEPPDAA